MGLKTLATLVLLLWLVDTPPSHNIISAAVPVVGGGRGLGFGLVMGVEGRRTGEERVGGANGNDDEELSTSDIGRSASRAEFGDEAATTSVEGVLRFGKFADGTMGTGISTHILLNGGMYRTQCDSSGKFIIKEVPPGTYMLEVVHPVLYFRPVLLEVEAVRDRRGKQQGGPEVSAYIFGPSTMNPQMGANTAAPNSAMRRLKVPLGLTPTEKLELFDKRTRPKDRVMWIVTDPKYLLIFGSFALLIVLKFLSEQIDPEELETATRSAAQIAGASDPSQYTSPFMTKVESAAT